jgi:hypothetical protein
MKILAFVALLSVLISLTGASTYFKVVDITPVVLQPNSQVSFTVKIQNLGTETEAVGLLFRNLTSGLLAANTDGTPYILPVQRRPFNCTMTAEDVAPGNYSFGVGVYALGAIPNWRDSYVLVQSTGDEVRPVQQSPVPVGEVLNASRSLPGNITRNLTAQPSMPCPTPEGNKTSGRAAPGAGAVIALAALLIAAGRFTR